jgi:hypothetical protein
LGFPRDSILGLTVPQKVPHGLASTDIYAPDVLICSMPLPDIVGVAKT